MHTDAYLKAYYQHYDEHGRLTSKHGRIEFITTMHYIRKYLKPGMRVMEIGAGTGRYSHALAQEGYEVDGVELVEHNIELFRQYITPGERITITQGTATDLSMFADNTYDITLLLGPMYHLYTKEDQLRALREAVRVTKTGGIIFAAYCMEDATILIDGFRRGHIIGYIQQGMIDPDTFRTVSEPKDLFELYRKEDIEALRARLPVRALELIAADGYAHHMKATIDAMDDQTYEIYINYHLATCHRQDMIGYSNHTLDIFRKE